MTTNGTPQYPLPSQSGLVPGPTGGPAQPAGPAPLPVAAPKPANRLAALADPAPGPDGGPWAQPRGKAIRCLVYGDPGAGKSFFAASFPTPLLVWAFDPADNMQPYLNDRAGYRQGTIQLTPTVNILKEEVGEGENLIRVEHYCEQNIDQPAGWQVWRELRFPRFDAKRWRTVVIDSATAMVDMARLHDEKNVNRGQDKWTHHNQAKESVMPVLTLQLVSHPFLNVVLVCHVGKATLVHGTILQRHPAFPGTLSSTIGRAYGEMYRSYLAFDKQGKVQRALQTIGNPEFNAKSMIKAGGSLGACHNNYEALWANWKPLTEQPKAPLPTTPLDLAVPPTEVALPARTVGDDE